MTDDTHTHTHTHTHMHTLTPSFLIPFNQPHVFHSHILRTGNVRLCRLARMFEHPIVADVTKSIWSFHSLSQVYVERCPLRLRGLPFGQLLSWYPDGIVLGLLDRHTGTCLVAPSPSTLVGPIKELVDSLSRCSMHLGCSGPQCSAALLVTCLAAC